MIGRAWRRLFAWLGRVERSSSDQGQIDYGGFADLVADLRVVAEMFPADHWERREVVLRAADVIEELDRIVDSVTGGRGVSDA